MSELIKNPYKSPSETRRNSGAAALALADQINALTEKGERVFSVPIGVVKEVARLLRRACSADEQGQGWIVDIQSAPEAPTKLATLVLRAPDDWAPGDVGDVD